MTECDRAGNCKPRVMWIEKWTEVGALYKAVTIEHITLNNVFIRFYSLPFQEFENRQNPEL